MLAYGNPDTSTPVLRGLCISSAAANAPVVSPRAELAPHTLLIARGLSGSLQTSIAGGVRRGLSGCAPDSVPTLSPPPRQTG